MSGPPSAPPAAMAGTPSGTNIAMAGTAAQPPTMDTIRPTESVWSESDTQNLAVQNLR